ncbi:HNH endonuclease [Rossellomorea vietnamensis]|uniref:HNH endonuclease n=1 Tax=Rossellomorea vietnamensis TaxID=218284 RepID=A0A5D4K895_9BACI|nr:HNH endonuclease [Rossellomorea vietnamensis]TYR73462.1 HNH endonuclease [Rossellomorea vietnamensis]
MPGRVREKYLFIGSFNDRDNVPVPLSLESQFGVVLAEDVYLATDEIHFSIANDTLYQSIQTDPDLADKLGLTSSEVAGLKFGHTPDGFVWHHAEQPGVLQLVDEDLHQNTGHTGGRDIWGGGSDNR